MEYVTRALDLTALLRDSSVFLFGPRRRIVVARESRPRLIDGIECLPWRDFLDQLWDQGL